MKTNASHHFPLLELARFCAAFSVVIYHVKHFYLTGVSGVTSSQLAYQSLAFSNVFGPLYTYGFLAVPVFWAISGFIIAYKYQGSCKSVSLRTFIFLRLSRLYPLVFLSLIVTACVQYIYYAETGSFFLNKVNDLDQFIAHILLISGWSTAWRESFNHPVWSVSVEVISYLIFYLWIRFVRNDLIGLFQLLGLAILARVLFGANSIVLCLILFFCGSIIYNFHCILASRLRAAAGMASCIVASLGFAWLSVSEGRANTLGVIAIGCGVVGACVFLESDLMRRFQPYVTALGNLTYSSYLIHFPLQIMMSIAVFWSFGGTEPLASQTSVLIYIVVTFLLAHVSFTYFERPMQAVVRWRLLGVYPTIA
ncbi:acyltransferase [uncultured Rhodoblastus sp.]|uniref:acyltransferase family protein n=1 Tax=uncultured Rhodoblastus sp. TaxID=543037 RepID=UPI0025EF4D8A|nr:acyltransferase [uncultured Rhodoblastus sp.]